VQIGETNWCGISAVKKALFFPSLPVVIGASLGFYGLFAGAHRKLALAFVFALVPALAPLSAHAQLRGLTGSVGGIGGAVGGVGSSLPDSSPLGTNVRPNLPAADPSLPSVPRPDLSQPALTRPVDTVTNTLSGSVGSTLAVPSRATGQLGNAVNRGAARAPSCERALNPPQLWASNFPQFCRGG
jgi:hypothetical protein